MLSLSEKELTQLDSVLSEAVIMLFKKALSPSRDVDTFVHYHGLSPDHIDHVSTPRNLSHLKFLLRSFVC